MLIHTATAEFKTLFLIFLESVCNYPEAKDTNVGMSPPSHSENQQQFARILDENRVRFGRLARVYAGESAEDLLQNMLMQVWQSLPNFSGDSAPNTWAYRIALNTAITWQRDARRLKRTPPKTRVDESTLATNGSFTDEAQTLLRFLDSLNEIDRAILLMYLDDVPVCEMAATMGISDGAIRTRVSRIRTRLKNWEMTDG